MALYLPAVVTKALFELSLYRWLRVRDVEPLVAKADTRVPVLGSDEWLVGVLIGVANSVGQPNSGQHDLEKPANQASLFEVVVGIYHQNSQFRD